MISKLITGLTSLYQSIRLNIGGWVVYQAAMEGVNVTTIAGTFAQLSMLGKIKAVTLAIKEQAAAFLATPIGKITLIVAAVAGIAAVVTSATDAWQKQVEAAREAIKVNEENIANYQNEIDSLEALQEKLQNAKGDKEALAAIQEELNEAIGATPNLINGEASAYEAATQKIKDQIAATKELLETQRQELVNNNSAIFDNNGVQRSLLGADWLKADVSGKVMRELINEYYKKYNEFISRGMSEEQAKQMASMEMKVQNTGALTYEITEKEWEDYWNNQVSTAYKVFESTISSYNGFGGSEFIKQIIDDSVRRGHTLEEINSIISEISSSPFQSVLNDYYESLADPNADSQAVYNDLISKINELKTKYPELADTFDLYSKHIADKLDNVAEAAEDAETSFKSIAKTLSDGLDKLSNKKDILSEVKEELDSFGAISADNISKILEQFSDDDGVQQAVAYYLSGIGTAQQVYDAMAKGYQNDLKLQAKKLSVQMQNDENYYKSLAKLHGDFTEFEIGNQKINISNCKNLADAKLKIENTLIGTFKKNWGKYYSWANSLSAANIDTQIKTLEETIKKIPKNAGRPEVKAELTARLGDLISIKKAMSSAFEDLDELILKDFNTTGFNASLSTDFDKTAEEKRKEEIEKHKEAAEAEIAKLKYKLETNQITEEKYLKELDSAYKRYYNKTADYLEDYAKYSQEVYDGFKDMYKEDLEAQKEAWEEKKDAVSEYYDNLREQIEDAHDEEDYEKEQSEKRKEIFDLDMKIAELMRDGGEKAKARIAELEEERLKAEEELLDFETDKAREDELSRLEKEQKAEEDKIQAEIDKIDADLKRIDDDIVGGIYDVRKTIVDYAAKQGVTLDFAYASGTRSSVGGFGRINEKGIEMISAPDGNGNYIPMLPNSYVFSAKATEFLWKLATEHSLPQAMYNSIAKSIKTQSSTPSVNIAQPITITIGDVIIKGNADKQTVADIKKQQENTVRMVLQKIKELQK